jgi:hypothetical protein
MNAAETIATALTTIEALNKLIPALIANAKRSGELTADQEREFQARQEAVFSQPYAQPESVSDTPPLPGPHDATKPDL